MLNEQVIAKRAIGRRRYERRYARHRPPVRKARRVAAPIERLPSVRYTPPRRYGFDLGWLTSLLTKQLPPPKPKGSADEMGAPRFIEFVDQKGRKLLKDMLAYSSRSKYKPHQGGGQYEAARQGRRGMQS